MGSQSFCTSTLLLLLIGFSATLAVCHPTSNTSQIFEDWITKHKRVYSSSEEKARRFEIFKDNYLFVQKFNKEEGKPYTVGINKFSDMTLQEFQCNHGCRRTGVKSYRTLDFPLQGDDALEQAVSRRPEIVRVASNSTAFINFRGGMFRGPCGNRMDHNVLVVGFGVDNDGTKYWKIQNSWGDDWGDDEYMKMSYAVGEECGITTSIGFPLLKYEYKI